MAVTIYDLAREAGVSISTVSKALSGSYTISEKTRRHVLETARRLQYKPNARAQLRPAKERHRDLCHRAVSEHRL